MKKIASLMLGLSLSFSSVAIAEDIEHPAWLPDWAIEEVSNLPSEGNVTSGILKQAYDSFTGTYDRWLASGRIEEGYKIGATADSGYYYYFKAYIAEQKKYEEALANGEDPEIVQMRDIVVNLDKDSNTDTSKFEGFSNSNNDIMSPEYPAYMYSGLQEFGDYIVVTDASKRGKVGFGVYGAWPRLYNSWGHRRLQVNGEYKPGTVFWGLDWMEMKGNIWSTTKGDLENIKITEDTVIEFEYACFEEGEIHGLGFQKSDGSTTRQESRKTRIRLNGTQRISRQGEITQYKYGADDMKKFKKFKIRLGDHYESGVYDIYFANDHDVRNPTAHSVFRNFKIYEEEKN